MILEVFSNFNDSVILRSSKVKSSQVSAVFVCFGGYLMSDTAPHSKRLRSAGIEGM